MNSVFAREQRIHVKYTGGSSCTVTLLENDGDGWTSVLSTWGHVGQNGVGKTREGDRKTPLGCFCLSMPFGKEADPGCTLPYTRITETMYWGGVSGTAHYNRFFDTADRKIIPSGDDEHLISFRDYYDYALWIEYNREGAPGKGSAIFLHCTGEKPYTMGCVAIPKDDMRKVLVWIREGCTIVIEA